MDYYIRGYQFVVRESPRGSKSCDPWAVAQRRRTTGFTLRNNALTFSVTFIFVGRLVDSPVSLSLGLRNNACPSAVPWMCPRAAFTGPSIRLQSTPVILERASYLSLEEMPCSIFDTFALCSVHETWSVCNARPFLISPFFLMLDSIS